MNPNDSRVIVNKLDGYVFATPINYNYEMLSRSDVTTQFTVQESGVQIGSVMIYGDDAATLGDGESDWANRGDGRASTVPHLADSTSTLKIIYGFQNATSATATGYINWLELTYTQQLSAVNNALLFTSPDTAGSVEYALTKFFGAGFSIFDITDVFNVKRVPFDSSQFDGTYTFSDNLTAGNIKRYWVGTASAYKTPLSFAKIPNTNLRAGITGADFVIITHHDFVSEALRLRDHKKSLPGTDALNTVVVEVDTIYNEFGNGLPDPVAIRDFLEYATTHWQPAPR